MAEGTLGCSQANITVYWWIRLYWPLTTHWMQVYLTFLCLCWSTLLINLKFWLDCTQLCLNSIIIIYSSGFIRCCLGLERLFHPAKSNVLWKILFWFFFFFFLAGKWSYLQILPLAFKKRLIPSLYNTVLLSGVQPSCFAATSGQSNLNLILLMLLSEAKAFV